MEATPRRINPAIIFLFFSALSGMLLASVVLLSERPAGTLDDPVGLWAVLNRPADDFALLDVDGQMVRLSDFRGRPVFVNLWGTWCPPCVREFPVFQEFMEASATHGAVILTINQGESAATVRAFLDELGIVDVPALLDTEMMIRRSFPAQAFPTTYLIDAEGIVRYSKIGEVTLEDLYAYLAALTESA